MSDSNQTSKVLIASDHAGFARKNELMQACPNVAWEDLGTLSEESVDYPDYADRIAKRITIDVDQSGEQATLRGILICGSGQGMAIRANRYPKIRAALCWSAEVAKLAREHNNANVLCMGSRVIDFETAKAILQVFLETKFAGGRHQQRVSKLGVSHDQC